MQTQVPLGQHFMECQDADLQKSLYSGNAFSSPRIACFLELAVSFPAPLSL